MSVGQFVAGTSLCVPVKFGGDFKCASVAEHGGRGNVIRERRQGVEKPAN